jgi:hypothetical protein
MKGVCEYHRSKPVMAEVERVTVVQSDHGTKTITYTVLRCPDPGCGRIRGTRRTVSYGGAS